MFSNLKIASLNTRGFNNNIVYINSLVSIFNILFLSEHWLFDHEINKLYNMNDNVKVFFQSDLLYKQKGRAFGGLCWLIHKNIKVLKHEFHNSNISSIFLDIGGNKICVIGVYMPFNNNTFERNLEYESNINLLTSICKDVCEEYTTFLCGDFNTGLKNCLNQNSYDKIFDNFIKENKSMILNYMNVQNIDHTYHSGSNKSYLDHFILFKENSLVNSFQCNIRKDLLNNSDHHIITLELNLPIINNETENKLEKSISYFNFNNKNNQQT